jgi:toxin ParE1/3/4
VKLVWFAQAATDLQHAEDFIALDDPTAATKVSRHLRCAVAHLQIFPDAGRLGNIPGTREVVIGVYPYLVRYRIKGEQVQILRVFHTSRQWQP